MSRQVVITFAPDDRRSVGTTVEMDDSEAATLVREGRARWADVDNPDDANKANARASHDRVRADDGQPDSDQGDGEQGDGDQADDGGQPQPQTPDQPGETTPATPDESAQEAQSVDEGESAKPKRRGRRSDTADDTGAE